MAVCVRRRVSSTILISRAPTVKSVCDTMAQARNIATCSARMIDNAAQVGRVRVSTSFVKCAPACRMDDFSTMDWLRVILAGIAFIVLVAWAHKQSPPDDFV